MLPASSVPFRSCCCTVVRQSTRSAGAERSGLPYTRGRMRLARLRRHWNELGRRDPLWAILTAPDKKGNRWSVDEFLQTGRDEIAALIAYLDTLHVDVARRRALDFGCGAGRLTRALADHFDEVTGVDIAASMVDIARQLHAGNPRCRFVLNEADTLEMCASGSV